MTFKRVWQVFTGSVEEVAFGRDTAAPAASTGASEPRRHLTNFPDLSSIDHAHFVEVLDELERTLRPGKRIALSGMPGVGKTCTAYEFARRLYAGPQRLNTFLVAAEERQSIRYNLANLAQPALLDLPGAEIPESADQVQEAAIRRVLQELSTRDDWLIVFDNMDGCFHEPGRFEEIKEYLPSSPGGRLLITTRDDPQCVTEQGINVIPIRLMTEEEGARFLLQRAGRNEDGIETKAAQRICHLVGGLPLALDQAAAYIRRKVQETRGDYTLADYLAEYQKIGSETRRHHPGGTHRDVFVTFKLPFSALIQGSETEKLAADFLRMCTFLDPDSIPRELLETYYPDEVPREQRAEALWEAVNLRLLKYEPNSRTVILHRAVRDVLRDILAEEGGETAWRRQAMMTLDRALSDMEMVPRLYPHLEAVAHSGASPEGFPLLREYLEGLNVMKALEEGDRWEKLVFGGESPSYKDMHRLEDDGEQTRVRRRMAAISSVCSEEHARLVFACVYLVVHYWWDSYLEGDHIADPLLKIWEQTHDTEADRMLLGTLRRFQTAYPPARNYKQRADSAQEMLAPWKEVARTMRAVREQLKIALPPGETATSAERYARGVTNIYLADALRYGRTVEGYHYPENGEALRLYEEAEAQFERNADEFHRIWAMRETADFLVDTGRRCHGSSGTDRSAGNDYAEKAARYFEAARGKCRSGLQAALSRARQDDIDAEVIANFYAMMADLEWEMTGRVSAAAGYRWAASYVAYAYVLAEQDIYGVRFYEEHAERTMDWIKEVVRSGSEDAVSLCQFLRKCSGAAALAQGTLLSLFARQDWDRLGGYLFPRAPELAGAGGNTRLTRQSRETFVRAVRAMPLRVASLDQYPLPETFPEVARMLKTQLADEAEGE